MNTYQLKIDFDKWLNCVSVGTWNRDLIQKHVYKFLDGLTEENFKLISKLNWYEIVKLSGIDQENWNIVYPVWTLKNGTYRLNPYKELK